MVLNYLLLASFHLANKMLLVGCYSLVDVTFSLSLSHILKPKYRRRNRLGWDLLELMTNLCIKHYIDAYEDLMCVVSGQVVCSRAGGGARDNVFEFESRC